VKLIKNVGHVFCQLLYLTKTFSVYLPAKINNPVPAIQVTISTIPCHWRLLGHSGNDFELFIDCTFRASASLPSTLRKLI